VVQRRHQSTERLKRARDGIAPMSSSCRSTLECRHQAACRSSSKIASITLDEADGRPRQSRHLSEFCLR